MVTRGLRLSGSRNSARKGVGLTLMKRGTLTRQFRNEPGPEENRARRKSDAIEEKELRKKRKQQQDWIFSVRRRARGGKDKRFTHHLIHLIKQYESQHGHIPADQGGPIAEMKRLPSGHTKWVLRWENEE